MLEAFDALFNGILKREGAAMDAKLRADGMTPERAAQGAQEHVQRIKDTMQQ